VRENADMQTAGEENGPPDVEGHLAGCFLIYPMENLIIP